MGSLLYSSSTGTEEALPSISRPFKISCNERSSLFLTFMVNSLSEFDMFRSNCCKVRRNAIVPMPCQPYGHPSGSRYTVVLGTLSLIHERTFVDPLVCGTLTQIAWYSGRAVHFVRFVRIHRTVLHNSSSCRILACPSRSRHAASSPKPRRRRLQLRL